MKLKKKALLTYLKLHNKVIYDDANEVFNSYEMELNQLKRDKIHLEIEQLMDRKFINYCKENIGKTIFLTGLKVYENGNVLELAYDSDMYDEVEVAFYLGMDFLRIEGYTDKFLSDNYIGESIIDLVNNRIFDIFDAKELG